MTYERHPLIDLADKHLDETLDRIEKSTRIYWAGETEWGKTVTNMSAAALVLSLSVAQLLVTKAVLTHWAWLLPASWILFAASVVLGAGHHSWLGAMSLGRFHFEQKRGDIRKQVADIPMDADDVSERFDAILLAASNEAEAAVTDYVKTYQRRSMVMFWSFAFGVVSLMAYAIKNLPG